MALIQGSSRGIGLSLVKRLLNDTDSLIISTSRHPDAARKHLTDALGAAPPASRVRFIAMDVTEEASVRAAAEEAKTALGGEKNLRLLVNCAGWLQPEKALGQVTKESLLEHLSTNLIGAVLVMKHFSPLFSPPSKSPAPASTPTSLQTLLPRPVCASISARTGSIGDNKLGGWYSYRIAKAGLNQAVRTASVELGRKGVVTVALHPGTVDTDLSRPFVKNAPHLLTPDQSADLLWSVIRGLKESDNGGFLDQNAKPIVW
ncbi:hypothetical protein HDU96_005799 [Phlyctochytrium bullatum]|nr:hypothetical protein HDU96_005799 [Phlyctochytrium bullatum]